MTTRNLSNQDALALPAGADHYRSFVGPAYRYDLIGGSQFGLLFQLGLREHHRLLDFGCGSLRLGRMAIPYLQADRYFGVEPEAWLVEEGFDRELGRDARALKRPRFDYNTEYRADVFGTAFDYIIAQSIFSHTGENATRRALHSFAASLAPGGMVVANWLIGPEDPSLSPDDCGWVYPGCVPFAPERIDRLATEAGLVVRRAPWHHAGGLTWHLLARAEDDLPPQDWLDGLGTAPLER